MSTLSHKPRFFRSPHEYRIPLHSRHSRLLHRVHILHCPPPDPWPTPPSVKLQPGPRWTTDQYYIDCVLDLRIRVFLHADGTETDASGDELEYFDVWGYSRGVLGVLLGQGETCV